MNIRFPIPSLDGQGVEEALLNLSLFYRTSSGELHLSHRCSNLCRRNVCMTVYSYPFQDILSSCSISICCSTFANRRLDCAHKEQEMSCDK